MELIPITINDHIDTYVLDTINVLELKKHIYGFYPEIDYPTTHLYLNGKELVDHSMSLKECGIVIGSNILALISNP